MSTSNSQLTRIAFNFCFHVRHEDVSYHPAAPAATNDVTMCNVRRRTANDTQLQLAKIETNSLAINNKALIGHFDPSEMCFNEQIFVGENKRAPVLHIYYHLLSPT